MSAVNPILFRCRAYNTMLPYYLINFAAPSVTFRYTPLTPAWNNFTEGKRPGCGASWPSPALQSEHQTVWIHNELKQNGQWPQRTNEPRELFDSHELFPNYICLPLSCQILCLCAHFKQYWYFCTGNGILILSPIFFTHWELANQAQAVAMDFVWKTNNQIRISEKYSILKCGHALKSK